MLKVVGRPPVSRLYVRRNEFPSLFLQAWGKVEERLRLGHHKALVIALSLRPSQVEDDAKLLAGREVSAMLNEDLQKSRRSQAESGARGEDPPVSDAESYSVA